MRNDLEYSLYMPADNVGHEREAGFAGEEFYLSTWLASSFFSMIYSQIIFLVNLFMKLFQQPLSPCPFADSETRSQMLFIGLCQWEGHSVVKQIAAGLHHLYPGTTCFFGLGKDGVGLQVPCEGKLERWVLVIHQVPDNSAFDQCLSHWHTARLRLLSI